MRVCFVSHHAYPLFDPQSRFPIGGAETHAFLLARGLAELAPFDVHFVVQTPRWFRQRLVDKIRLWNLGDPFDPMRRRVSQRIDVLDGWPWLRVREWHLSLLWEVPWLAAIRSVRGRQHNPGQPHPLFSAVAPDVICCFGVSGHSATAITSAKELGCPSVLFLESNNDLDERFTQDSSYVTPYGERGDLCHDAVTSADVIVAQSSVQQELLKNRFGRDSVRMTNAIDLAWWDQMSAAQCKTFHEHAVASPYVLWIGRADEFHKRPAICLELARQCPSMEFVMILNPGDPAIERDVRAQVPANVTIVPRVPYHEMPAAIAGATAYVSTGSTEYEGSPNVFLQAAASGVPVLSLEVSSDQLQAAQCMICAGGDINAFAKSVQRIWNDPHLREQLGKRGRTYIEENCQAPHVANELARLLEDRVETAVGLGSRSLRSSAGFSEPIR